MLGTHRPRLWRSSAPRDLRRLFQALPDAVLAVRADAPRFTIAAVSDAYLHATFTQRAGPTGIVGRGLFDVFPAAPHEDGFAGARNLRASLERVIATRTAHTMATQPYEIRRPDGTWEERHWSPLNVPVLDDHDRVDYIIHRVEDVTALRQLGEANETKVRFLASMSHELRTPLTAIGGYVDLMMMGVHGPITDQQRAVLERIRRSEQHLLALITQVLSYAKVESGRVAIDPRSVRVNVVVDEVLALVSPQAQARGLRLIVTDRAGSECDLDVFADQDKVRQILVNLVSNAIKFTEPGGTITIDCEARDQSAAIMVIDTGVGIASNELSKIFEPFVQLGSRETTEQGTGLGLPISRDLARAMGGDLVARSRIGEGSSFTLLLPRAGAADRRDRRSA
jgi:signal transduction histidine kinase